MFTDWVEECCPKSVSSAAHQNQKQAQQMKMDFAGHCYFPLQVGNSLAQGCLPRLLLVLLEYLQENIFKDPNYEFIHCKTILK